MVKINNMDTTVFQRVEAPTPSALSNTTILATASFVRTLMNSLNLVINNVFDNLITYTITAVKTIPEIIIGTVSGTSIAIGSSLASSVNVLSSSNLINKLYIRTTLQALLPAGTTGYSVPFITNNSSSTKIATGLLSLTSGGSTINFPQPFSIGCVPIILVNVTNGTPSTVILYQPSGTLSHIGFGASIGATSKFISYIAFGY